MTDAAPRIRPGSVSCAALLLFAPAFGGTAAAEDPANYTETIKGTKLTFDMVYIPGGTFKLGSPDGEAGRDPDEGPVAEVAVEPFWMGKYEVTWPEYEQYWLVEETADGSGADAVTRPSAAYEPPDHGWGRDKNPAIHLTLHAATHYCEWVSAKTGRIYRLPTEAEWEFACRGGTTSRYFFGDDPAALGEYAWFADNSREKTHPVGQKKPNPYGLYDILGNVWEYCSNPYTSNYAEKPPPAGSKRKPKSLLRGGSFKDPPEAFRSANRVTPLPEWNQRNPQRPPGPWWYTDGEMCGLRLVRPFKTSDAK
jgi:formylglycine-generating enzyme required for sulfatase activity